MRSRCSRGLLATTLSLFLAGTSAQTGTLSDLGTLLASQKNLTTFYSLIQKYPAILLQLPSYNGVTILAPSDDAFSKIPYTSLNTAFASNDQDTITNVLEYHIIQGTRDTAQLVPGTPVFLPTLLTSPEWANVTGGQRVECVEQAGDVVVFVSGQGSRSTLVSEDLDFTGGVVQIIDSLLIPPTDVIETTTAFNLTSFQGALYTSKENGTFMSPNVTIFAPANEAFEALGPAISTMTVEQLARVLDYHLLPDVFYSTSLTNGSTFTTHQGGNITVRHSGNNVYINSAQLLTTDILIENGVLHIIDNVLNPDGPSATPNPNLNTQVPAFASASSVPNLPFTSAIPCTTSCAVSSTSVASAKSASATSLVKTTAQSTSTFQTSSSKAAAAPVARETGFGAAGWMVALGGAAMML